LSDDSAERRTSAASSRRSGELSSASASASPRSQSSPGAPAGGVALVDSKGWLTAAGVVLHLENALTGLTAPSTLLADRMPVESVNPMPLILAARKCILDNLEAWCACTFDADGNGGGGDDGGGDSIRLRRDTFVRAKQGQARELLQTAASMHADPRWKELRVDHVQRDMDAICDAQRLLTALNAIAPPDPLPAMRSRR
jgi:hypothetical protein